MYHKNSNNDNNNDDNDNNTALFKTKLQSAYQIQYLRADNQLLKKLKTQGL